MSQLDYEAADYRIADRAAADFKRKDQAERASTGLAYVHSRPRGRRPPFMVVLHDPSTLNLDAVLIGIASESQAIFAAKALNTAFDMRDPAFRCQAVRMGTFPVKGTSTELDIPEYNQR